MIFHFDPATMKKAAELAKAFEDPQRLEEMYRYHKAMLDALNATHTNGKQDSLGVFEAVALLLAQLVGDLPADERRGTLQYIAARAEYSHVFFKEAGLVAAHELEDDA